MVHKVKIDLQAKLKDDRVVVELGSGQFKKQGSIGIDLVDGESVDIVANLDLGLPFLPDDSVDEISSSHVLEHLDNLELILREMVRVLKPNGISKHYIPHFSNPWYFRDYTHKKFFSLYTLDAFVNDEDLLYKKRIWNYYSNIRIVVVNRRLIFSSYFKPLHYIKKGFQVLVNSHPAFQEFYEENLCWVIPCHGIEISFKPK